MHTSLRWAEAAEHAVVWDEVEAKLSEEVWGDLPFRVQPHHLTTARHRLGKDGDGLIIEQHKASKGSHLVTTLQLADTTDRANATLVAARRKRALQSRYVSGTQGNNAQRERVGIAGEHVTHAALIAAAPHGFHLIQPHGGEVRRLFDAPVPGGPLDSAAWLNVIGEDGRPDNFLCLVEVKNLRSWVYPSTHELYQLLDKAARLQAADESLPIIPLLVCRRSHATTGKMAKQLGFFVLDMQLQPLVWEADEDARLLQEVVEELRYNLLPIGSRRDSAPALPRLVGGLSKALPDVAQRTAATWKMPMDGIPSLPTFVWRLTNSVLKAAGSRSNGTPGDGE